MDVLNEILRVDKRTGDGVRIRFPFISRRLDLFDRGRSGCAVILFDLIREVMESKAVQESLEGNRVIVQDLNPTVRFGVTSLKIFFSISVPLQLRCWILAMEMNIGDRVRGGIGSYRQIDFFPIREDETLSVQDEEGVWIAVRARDGVLRNNAIERRRG